MDRLRRGRVETERDCLGQSTLGSRSSGVVGVAGHGVEWMRFQEVSKIVAVSEKRDD